MGKKKRFIQYLIPVVIVLLASPMLTQVSLNRPEAKEELKCMICLRSHHPSSLGLSTGYNYELLQKFGENIQVEPQVIIGDSPIEALQYLQADSIDIAIIPYNPALTSSGLFSCSRMHVDSTMWVVHKENRKFSESVRQWFKMNEQKDEYKELERRFTPAYEPYKRAELGMKYQYASPYDDLIKKYAKSIGWDWRMLAALIWQESRFRIDARSGRGAEGLLQMLPSTAKRFSNDDMLDPEKNIEAGVKYLKRLQAIFSQFCNEESLTKFTLAAYSAGEGRVLDCIRYARAHGIPYSDWKDLEGIITILRDSEEAKSDTLLQHGGLRGFDTINYVSSVYSLYDAFMIISPGPSSQDQPAKHTETESGEES